MQTNFDLQMNTMKSNFEAANTTINNKIALIQNDVSSMDSKLDTGFTNTQSLISQLSNQLNQFVTAFASPTSSSPPRLRKKRQETVNKTLDSTIDDDLLSSIGGEDISDEDNNIC
ncbi:predicted protein [Chaetoceros tenuissimus]|uniref:Uncharacterized protein n=1 Tax=Chaetoceros tenuissimus TaxID=426638 RepID=A0AAD3D0I5_9STRA|nr:predicted protein [Chaetoceros tenuissimus]